MIRKTKMRAITLGSKREREREKDKKTVIIKIPQRKRIKLRDDDDRVAVQNRRNNIIVFGIFRII